MTACVTILNYPAMQAATLHLWRKLERKTHQQNSHFLPMLCNQTPHTCVPFCPSNPRFLAINAACRSVTPMVMSTGSWQWGNSHQQRKQTRKARFIIYLFIEGLQSSQPHRVISGLFTKSNITDAEYNTTCTFYKHKTDKFNILRNLVPSDLLL